MLRSCVTRVHTLVLTNNFSNYNDISIRYSTMNIYIYHIQFSANEKNRFYFQAKLFILSRNIGIVSITDSHLI